jgi:hypothetical protein
MLAKIDFVFGKPVDAVLVPDDANRVESAVCPTRSVFQPLHVIRGEAERNHDRVNTSDDFRKFGGVGRCVRCRLPSQQENVLLVALNWHLSRSLAQSASSHFSKTFVRNF